MLIESKLSFENAVLRRVPTGEIGVRAASYYHAVLENSDSATGQSTPSKPPKSNKVQASFEQLLPAAHPSHVANGPQRVLVASQVSYAECEPLHMPTDSRELGCTLPPPMPRLGTCATVARLYSRRRDNSLLRSASFTITCSA